MKRSLYDQIVVFISNHPAKLFRDVVNDVTLKYGDVATEDTLLSICLIQHQKSVKKNIVEKSKDYRVEKYFKTYMERAKTTQGTKSRHLLSIAMEHNIPPALLARMILNRFITEREAVRAMEAERNGKEPGEKVNVKAELSSMMKDPFTIPDRQLSHEVRQCILHDLGYGCVTDSIRHMVGTEYEDKLREMVERLNVPFQDETELRKLGYDKTPDVKLQIPIAVAGRVVCWIESKASFGTPECHRQYLQDQYYSYLNRFGPGLVIYWFGFVDELSNDDGENIMLSDRFPSEEQITLFNPELQSGSFSGDVTSTTSSSSQLVL